MTVRRLPLIIVASPLCQAAFAGGFAASGMGWKLLSIVLTALIATLIVSGLVAWTNRRK